MISTQHSEQLKTHRSKEVAGILVPVRTDAPDIVEYEHDDRVQVTEKKRAALRAETDASLAKPGCSIQESSNTLQRRPWSTKLRIEAKTRVEEGTAALLKSQIRTR